MFGNYVRNQGIRLFIVGAIAAIVMFFLGVGELGRCIRAVFPAPRVAIADVGTSGLQSYSYVRVTGVRAVLERSVVVSSQKRSRSGTPIGEARMTGAYVPILGASDKPDTLCTLLAYLPHARSDADIETLAPLDPDIADSEPTSDLVGFVKCSYDRLDGNEQAKIAPLARVNSRNCWVIDVRPPSWFKGLGLVLGGIAIPALFILVRMKFSSGGVE